MKPEEDLKITEKAKRKKVFRYIIAIFIIIFFSGLAFVGVTFNNVLEIFTDKKGNTLDNLQEIVSPLEKKVNILLLGSDISYDQRGRKTAAGPTRSDTMILARFDPLASEIRAISIPRDTRVLIPGYGYDKINAAFAYGGEKLARQTVTELTGVPVDHYVIIKVEGLVNIVDILGGIDIFVDRDMKYTDNTAKLKIDLKKGWQHLNGEQAHGYVRFRYDENGDLGRVQRQQKFIQAVLSKMINPLNILKIPELAEEVRKNIISDLPPNDLLRLGYFARKLRKDQIRMVLLPGSFASGGGISYWVPDTYVARIIIRELFPDTRFALDSNTASPAPDDEKAVLRERKRYRISIRDGTEDYGFSSEIRSLLRKNGWSVVAVSKTREPADISQLIVQTGISRHVPALKEALGFEPEIINASTGDFFADYTIVLGRDMQELFKSRNK